MLMRIRAFITDHEQRHGLGEHDPGDISSTACAGSQWESLKSVVILDDPDFTEAAQSVGESAPKSRREASRAESKARITDSYTPNQRVQDLPTVKHMPSQAKTLKCKSC